MSIWGRRVLGGQQDSYRLILGHELKHGAPRAPPQYHVHGGSEDGAVYDCVDVVWSEDESEATIVQRVAGVGQMMSRIYTQAIVQTAEWHPRLPIGSPSKWRPHMEAALVFCSAVVAQPALHLLTPALTAMSLCCFLATVDVLW